MHRVDPEAQIKGIAADTCYARSQVITVDHTAVAQTQGQEVIAVQPWNEKMQGHVHRGQAGAQAASFQSGSELQTSPVTHSRHLASHRYSGMRASG